MLHVISCLIPGYIIKREKLPHVTNKYDVSEFNKLY